MRLIECIKSVAIEFIQVFCWVQFGKKVKENEILRNQNKQMQYGLQMASRPALSWDALLDWLRQGK